MQKKFHGDLERLHLCHTTFNMCVTWHIHQHFLQKHIEIAEIH